MNECCFKGTCMGLNVHTTGGKKSRETLPLKGQSHKIFLLRCFLSVNISFQVNQIQNWTYWETNQKYLGQENFFIMKKCYEQLKSFETVYFILFFH